MRALFLLAVTALALGCAKVGEMKKSLGDLMALQQGLTKEFDEHELSVNVNNSDMSVAFLDSKIGSLPTAERDRMALTVAKYVRDHFSGYDDLSTLRIGFQSKEETVGTATKRTETWYTLSTQEVGERIKPAAGTPPR